MISSKHLRNNNINHINPSIEEKKKRKYFQCILSNPHNLESKPDIKINDIYVQRYTNNLKGRKTNLSIYKR